MKFVSDPAISIKIQKMKQRVRWQEASIAERGIDQTRFVLDDNQPDNPEFSFMVIGDSGSGGNRGYHPQRRIAEQMLMHREDCRFVLHTGDVIYLVGSNEYYFKNFIEPYREFLVGGDRPNRIPYDKMTFNLPILPVLGNHDYYDLSLLYSLIAPAITPLRRLLQFQLNLDIGSRGSNQGKAYAKAFLDYLQDFNASELAQHLDQHYTAKTDSGRCLRYEPGQFTRLPNRYYTFRLGGIDFFALDSNTFNSPLPLPTTPEGDDRRRQLKQRLDELEEQDDKILATVPQQSDAIDDAEHADDLKTRITQTQEMKLDVQKQLSTDDTNTIDVEQLEWLQQKLIESWHTEGVRGRVLYFHHPPYVTETTKWDQGQTIAIRHRLRQVLDGVAQAVGSKAADRPLVDLVLNGHAHCLEHLRTVDTGHGDANINWLICGGSGYSLRRQRIEGPDLLEGGQDGEGQSRVVARSQLFVGRNGQGSQKRRPYSFLRIDVQDGRPPRFTIRPYITERFQGQWTNKKIEPFII